jgi:hypothetical protein
MAVELKGQTVTGARLFGTGSPSWCFVADRLDECPSGRFDSGVSVG